MNVSENHVRCSSRNTPSINSIGEVNKVLESRWKWGSKNRFLKKHHVDFDARIVWVEIIPIWVRIPSLPLVLWLEDVFEETCNSLGLYYSFCWITVKLILILNSNYILTHFNSEFQLYIYFNVSSILPAFEVHVAPNYVSL